MFEIAEFLPIILVLGAIATFLPRFTRVARMNRLVQQGFSSWSAGDRESALADYERIGELAKKVRNSEHRAQYRFISEQALGFIHRQLSNTDLALSHLQQALEIADEDSLQSAETLLLTRVEFALAVAAESGDVADEIEQIAVLVESLEESHQLQTISWVLPYLEDQTDAPFLTPVAIRILEHLIGCIEPAAQKPDQNESHNRSSNPTPHRSADESHPFRASAIAESESIERTASSVWIDAKLAQATLALYGGDRELESKILSQLKGSSAWWSMDSKAAMKANALLARSETYSGSVRKGVQMAAACLRSEIDANESPFSIAAAEMAYGIAVDSYGDYDQALAHYRMAYNRVVKAAKYPAQISAWYPAMCAVGFMEKGRYRDAAAMIDVAHQHLATDLGVAQRLYIRTLRVVFWRDLGRYETAFEIVEQVDTLIRDLSPLDNYQILNCEVLRAGLLLAMNRPTEAKSVADNASSVADRCPHQNLVFRSNLIVVKTAVDIALGETRSIQSRLNELAAGLKDQVSPFHSVHSTIEHQLGMVFSLRGEHRKALVHYRNARRIRAEHHRDNSPVNRLLVAQMAEASRQVGENDEADQYESQVRVIESHIASLADAHESLAIDG